jgi:hypothetical protein
MVPAVGASIQQHGVHGLLREGGRQDELSFE